jgi:hypothetical protein
MNSKSIFESIIKYSTMDKQTIVKLTNKQIKQLHVLKCFNPDCKYCNNQAPDKSGYCKYTVQGSRIK